MRHKLSGSKTEVVRRSFTAFFVTKNIRREIKNGCKKNTPIRGTSEVRS
jgi:hypothetical protein